MMCLIKWPVSVNKPHKIDYQISVYIKKLHFLFTPEGSSTSPWPFLQHENLIVNINRAAHAWHLFHPLASLPLCLGFDSRAIVFTPLPLFCSAISLNFPIANEIRAFRKCCVIDLNGQPVTSSFIGFCESPSQTLDQTTSISSKTPRWCWRTSAHQRSAPFKDTGR